MKQKNRIRHLPGTAAPHEQAKDGARLRLARLAHGLSQQDLAVAAGVTRQAVAGFEAGQWDPSLRVAIALARALDTSVEDLFGPPAALPPLDAVPLAPLPDGRSRVEIAQVATTTVTLPLAGPGEIRAGFHTSDGIAITTANRPDRCEVHPVVTPRPSLVVAGCDPALTLLRGPLGRLDPPVDLRWWPCSSSEALRLSAAGLVHVAGFHLSTEVGNNRALSTLQGLASAGYQLLQFASWREGLAMRPDLAPVVTDLVDVARHRLRLVNREPGAEARDLLEEQRQRLRIHAADIDGYDSAVQGHLLVASAVAARAGDIGITIEPAALSYSLRFVPLAHERSLLAVPQRHVTTPEVQALFHVLASPAVRNQLAALPAYHDTGSCGTRIATA